MSNTPSITSPNDRLGSPGFLLHPPDVLAASARSLSARADNPGVSPCQAESFRRSQGRVRARLGPDVTGTPTRHAGPASPGAYRSSWASPCAVQSTTSAMQAFSSLPPLSRPPHSEYEPPALRDQGPRWMTNAASVGGRSSAGGWESSSGGGHQSVASSGGPNRTALAGMRPCHDSFASTQKPIYTPDRSPQRPSPVAENGRSADSSTSSTPNTGCMPDYSYPSSTPATSHFPEYMKVFTVPKDVRYEEDVVIEPIIQNLGIGDKAMEQRITEQMSNIYDFFRRLYDQDQDEIRELQLQMEQCDMELQQLRQMKSALQAESGTTPSKQNQEKDQQNMLTPSRLVLRAAQHSVACSPGPPSLLKPLDKPVVSILVPAVRSPSPPLFKWWANVHALYHQHSTVYLGILFLLLLVLAVGLLAGLLSGRSADTFPSAITASLPLNPAVEGLWSTGLAFSVNMSQGTSTYFALLPTVALLATKQTPSASDLRSLLQGPEPSPLQSLTVACGERKALQSRSFTFPVAASSILGSPGAGQTHCEVADALPARCSLCPDVQPATNYTLVVAFSDSEAVYQMQVTTAPQPLLSSSPPLPSPLRLLPTSMPPPSEAPPPLSSPPGLPTPTAIPGAPYLKLAPTVSSAGQASFDLFFALSRPGLVRFMVQYPVLYAQASGMYVAFASVEPESVQALQMAPPSQAVIGSNGVVAAGVVNVTTELAYTVRVDGRLSGASNAAATCTCDMQECRCTVPAPCQGDMCTMGPSALMPNTTYKVFLAVSTPDGNTISQGRPVFVGSFTASVDTVGPILSSSVTIAQNTITPSGFRLSGLQLDTGGLIYVMVSRPSTDEQSISAGTATAIKEETITQTRRRQLASLRGRSRSILQQIAQVDANATSSDSLLVLDPAPATQVYTPACPRKVVCDSAKVVGTYTDQSVETLVQPVHCTAVASIRSEPLSQVLDGLSNDTVYIVRVITEDVASNHRVYRALVRTVDQRPPVFSAVFAQTAFQSLNLTVTLSEPGAVVGYLYTAADAVNLSLTASPTWPPSPQEPVIQQITAGTVIPGNGTTPSGPTTYLLYFNDSSINPNTMYTIALVARDLPGNVQPLIRLVTLATNDNAPPVWRAIALETGAINSSLRVQLDEPCTVFWFCFSANVSCPSAALLFGIVDSTFQPPSDLISRGNITIAVENGTASASIVGLRDSALFTLCLVANDASPYKNRQLSVRRLVFGTMDRTPPTLLASVISGTDGNFTCDRSTFRCQLSLKISISEPGTCFAALQYANVRRTNFTAVDLVRLNVSNPPSGVLRALSIGFNSSGATVVRLNDLASGLEYSLDIVAVDVVGNVQLLMQSLMLSAPDVTPPTFTLASAASIADSFITVNASLSEPCIIFWMVANAGTQAPNITLLIAAVQHNQTGTGTVAYAPAVPGGPLVWYIGNLAVGYWYDLHLLARDTAGNQQANLTSILRVRIQDSTQPVILNLTTSLSASGNRLVIRVNSSKPGTLRYTAIRSGAPIPRRQQLLEPSVNTASNFSGQITVPTAFATASAVTCVADGSSYDIWAIIEDTEGQFQGRLPNYSNITQATQVLPPSTDTGVCSPEGRMRSLLLDTTLTQGSFGWPVGRISPAATSSNDSSVSWVRDYFLVGGLGGGVGTAGSVVATMEGQAFGTMDFEPTRPTPTQMRVVVQTPTLYLEPVAAVTSVAADTGRVLRFAFQVLDSASRPTSFDGLRLMPRLSSSSYATLVLPDCTVSLSGGYTSMPSGAGVCRVEVPAQAFPGAGASLQASLSVDLYNGSTLFVLTSAVEVISLRSAAAPSPSVPATSAVLLVALPTRPLRLGETFRVTLSAFVGSQQAITGYTIKVPYNASVITFVRAEKSSLWSDLDAVPLPDDAGGMVLWLIAMQRTAADSMYQNRLVPLLDAYFNLANTAGPDSAQLFALRVGKDTGDIALVSAAPQKFEPIVMFQDFQAISVAISGSIKIATRRELGLLAYLTNHDLFNSAAIDGKDVIAPIQVFTVSDWGPSGAYANTLSLPSGSRCSCSAPANVSNALTVASCQVVLTAAHYEPVKQARLLITCGNNTALMAQAFVSVWYPGKYRVELSDPDGTLSSLLPVNVPMSSVERCTDRYQTTRMYLFTTWTNGGASLDDFLPDVDVTSLVANWTADSSVALRVSNAVATGLSPHPRVNVSALAIGGKVLATTQLAVSSEPVCVEALEAVALSSVSISSETMPRGNGRWRVRLTPQQDLNWEGASAKVTVFATLSDGTIMPVSRASTTIAQALANFDATNMLPFNLQPVVTSSLLNLAVNTSFGSAAACGPFLRTSWSICSGAIPTSGGVLMAKGSGTVRVALPTPVRIDALQPSSLVVTSAGSGASQPPISVPTQCYLKVMVAFDDGVVRNMVNDTRIQIFVQQGADLCRVLQDTVKGQWYMEAIAGKLGSCKLEARASFTGLPVLRANASTTVVTFMSLQVYVPDGTPALPPTTNSSVLINLASQIDPIYLFKCDFSHYMPASVWAMGKLSSCGVSCNLADLNDPSITRLLLTDRSVVNLETNPSNVSLTNVLSPIKPGKSVLRVSFGTAISNVFTVSVEDAFLAGWPRVLNISDTGMVIEANMSSGWYTVTYLVQPQYGSISTTMLTAVDVERAGVAMTALDCTQDTPCMLTANATGLSSATNYTVYLVVRFEVVGQSKLINTVFTITGVLTPDVVAPSFTTLSEAQNITLDVQRFSMRIPVALDEPGTISYAVYRNSSCMTGPEHLPVQTVQIAGALPTSICACDDTSLCQPVAWGNITFSGDRLHDALTISGLLPPNPYNVLSSATPDKLTCYTDQLPAPTTTAHMLYLIAQDDLPTYKEWNVTCMAPESSPGNTCAAVALAPCSATPPSAGSAVGDTNVQRGPYKLVQLGASSLANTSESPLLASFDLPAGDRVIFDPEVTAVTVTSRTITFQFKVNGVAAVQYRLDQFNGSKASSGIYPVYDPIILYNVTISKACNGLLLVEPSYTLWYWATDVYGRSSPPLSASIVLG